MSIPYAEVIGDPIAHSKSPLIHKFWLEKLRLQGDYASFRVPPEELQDYLSGALGDANWVGCNVTSPHKQAVLAHLDRISPEAAAVGAANVVVREEGATLAGYNSDGAGFLEPLRRELAQPNLFRMARLFGAGGAARAIAHALAGQNFTLVLSSRNQSAAEKLLAEIKGDHFAAPLSHFAPPTDFDFDDRQGMLDLVINATPLGMAGQPPLAIDWSHVPPGSIIYDIVYSPLETPLIAEARARGHRVVDGLSMLIGQAAVAFEMFFGQPAPRQHDAALRELLTR